MRQVTIVILLSAITLSTGCTIGPVVWTSEKAEELRIDTAALAGLEAQTSNGSIEYVGTPDSEPTAVVSVTKKGGGISLADAEAALAAVEVYVESPTADTRRVAWRWKSLRQASWGADVEFRIRGPEKLRFVGESHNGRIEVRGLRDDVSLTSHNGSICATDVQGGVRLISHNGRIQADCRGGPLSAETYNGEVKVVYAGPELSLTSHNGEIEADLSKCQAIRGSILSHNGGITLTTGGELSAEMSCHTHNGIVRSSAAWQVTESTHGKLVGKMGQGEGCLSITTHNGSIHVKPR